VSNSLFFYDLETSGIDPKTQRIMQFAGQRTDMDLKPIGDPINVLVALSEDVLPDPAAILITGITPQKSRDEGYCEADFVKLLQEQVLLPGTVMVGFNNVRFDDEFMRYTLYRNFHDPYEWAWQDNRSRWDLLDVIRMTRALRPEGIKWPVKEDGGAVNRLELISSENGLDHANAHDALSDVQALLAVAQLLKTKQPKLFDYLLKMRDKKEVAKLVNLDDPQPFVYTSGRYPIGLGHTTVAFPIAPGGKPGSVIVYDLRHNPEDWEAMQLAELKDVRFANYEQRQMEGFVPLPVKELAYNKCPAIAPMGVLDVAAQTNLKIDLKLIQQNLAKLKRSGLPGKIREVFDGNGFAKQTDVDAQLYDGFVNDRDKAKMSAVRAATPDDLADFKPDFADERLGELLVRYKARNFPQSLTESELVQWDQYRSERINRDLPKFLQSLSLMAGQAKTTSSHFTLQELQLWAESIAPVSD
jgi:exodeoxyribonuclease-1